MFPVIVYKRILVALIAVVFSHVGIAQIDSEIINSKPSYLKKAGKRSLSSGDYYGAIEYFKKYLESKPEKIKVLFYLAESYRKSRDYVNAVITYEKVITLDPDAFPKAYYYLAKMKIHVQKYEEATAYLGKFKKAKYDGKDASIFKKRMKLLLLTCAAAPDLLKNKQSFDIFHMDTSINKAHIESSPFLLDSNTLIYSSLRSDTIVYYDASDTTKAYPVRKFYSAKKNEKQEWVFDKELDIALNDAKSHNVNACYNLDSTSLFFTRCATNAVGKMICAIYESKKEDNEWLTPVKLPETVNNPEFSSSQPAIGRGVKYGAEVLYYVTDNTRGKGGRDIWYSEYNKKKKKFNRAKNAGSKINTALDEMTPVYDRETKTMYFSSEGWPGIGGLDVFSTFGQLKNWETPVNIGSPINTSTDELYYVNTKEGDKGFVISNRKGGVALKNETCCDDIYEFKVLKFIYLGLDGIATELYIDTNNLDSAVALRNATIQLYAIQDSTNERILLKETLSDENGKYFFKLQKEKNYFVKARSKTTLAGEYAFSTKNASVSDTITKNFNLRHVSEKPIVVKNIYYEFDKSDLLQSSKTTIDTTLLEILTQNPGIIIEIGSHTDSKGSDVYNTRLSQSRAESVVKYLKSKGIIAKRLKAKGYGETSPIAPNENPDGSDNEQGRAMNRRTEFRIVGTIKGVSEIIYEK